jgi:hypothetical protein
MIAFILKEIADINSPSWWNAEYNSLDKKKFEYNIYKFQMYKIKHNRF